MNLASTNIPAVRHNNIHKGQSTNEFFCRQAAVVCILCIASLIWRIGHRFYLFWDIHIKLMSISMDDIDILPYSVLLFNMILRLVSWVSTRDAHDCGIIMTSDNVFAGTTQRTSLSWSVTWRPKLRRTPMIWRLTWPSSNCTFHKLEKCPTQI